MKQVTKSTLAKPPTCPKNGVHLWVTVIPAVILWNTARVPLLSKVSQLLASDGIASLLDMLIGTLIFSCALAAVTGYLAALIAALKRISAGVNVAFGLTIAFGLQNYVEHRHVGVTKLYFVALPIMSALAAIGGSSLCALLHRAVRPKRRRGVRLGSGAQRVKATADG